MQLNEEEWYKLVNHPVHSPQLFRHGPWPSGLILSHALHLALLPNKKLNLHSLGLKTDSVSHWTSPAASPQPERGRSCSPRSYLQQTNISYHLATMYKWRLLNFQDFLPPPLLSLSNPRNLSLANHPYPSLQMSYVMYITCPLVLYPWG